VIYAAFAITALQRGDLIHVITNDGFVFVLMWVIAGYLLLGVVINFLSRSRPERYTMAPLSLILGLLAAAIAIS
jgi:prepilin signal peptidase PulO-like enzyme (type II secretory pathway)